MAAGRRHSGQAKERQMALNFRKSFLAMRRRFPALRVPRGFGVNGCRFPRKSSVGIKPDVVTRDSRRTALNFL
jgi:hypothetical protein